MNPDSFVWLSLLAILLINHQPFHHKNINSMIITKYTHILVVITHTHIKIDANRE